MPAPTVTLENVAECIDAQMAGWSLDRAITKTGRRIRREAALVRAADDALGAARIWWNLVNQPNGVNPEYQIMDRAEAACAFGLKLAAFDKISRGEAP